MALSDQERKLLEQLEASLAAEDPQFAEQLRNTNPVKVHRRRAAIAGIGFIVGVAVLIGGLQHHPAISILGFVLMLGATIIGTRAWQRVSDDDPEAEQSSQRPPKPKDPHQAAREAFLEQLNEQWRRRQERGDSD